MFYFLAVLLVLFGGALGALVTILCCRNLWAGRLRPLAEQQMGPLRGGSWGPRENRSFRGEKDERRSGRIPGDEPGGGNGAREDELPARLMRQFENFFNYDGTGRGQKDLDD